MDLCATFCFVGVNVDNYNSAISTVGYGSFYNHNTVLLMLIVEEPTVTVEGRTAIIQVLFLYLTLPLSVMLDNLLCSFTFFLTK